MKKYERFSMTVIKKRETKRLYISFYFSLASGYMQDVFFFNLLIFILVFKLKNIFHVKIFMLYESNLHTCDEYVFNSAFQRLPKIILFWYCVIKLEFTFN